MSAQFHGEKWREKEALPEAGQIEAYANGLRLLAKMIARHYAADRQLRYSNPNHEGSMTENIDQPEDNEEISY